MPGKVLGSLAFLLIAALGLAVTAPAQAASTATVQVNITIPPIAQVDVPGRFEFMLHVPPDPCAFQRYAFWPDRWHDVSKRCRAWLSSFYHPVIQPVRMSFSVLGNALTTISLKPTSYLHLRRGPWIGKATDSNGRTLGYQIVVHFPAPNEQYAWRSGWESYTDWNYWRGWGGFGTLPSWSHWAKLPGIDDSSTPPLTADMVRHDGRAYGVIYVVARSDWTIDGRNAAPGDYAGAIELTIVAQDR